MKTLQSLHKIASQKVDKIQEEIAKLLGVMQQMDDREKQLLQQVDYQYQKLVPLHLVMKSLRNLITI